MKTLCILGTLALLIAAPLSARAGSLFTAAVARTLSGQRNYRNPTLSALSQTGGDEIFQPLAEELEADLKVVDLSVLDFEEMEEDFKVDWLDHLVPKAIARADDKGLGLAADVRRGLAEGKDASKLHGEADHYLHTFAPYLGHGRAFHDLSRARFEAWQAMRTSLMNGGTTAAGVLAAGKSDAPGEPTAVAEKRASEPSSAPRLKYSHGYYLEDLAPGMTTVVSQTVTTKDITLFAKASGDDQDIHTTSHAAEDSILGGPGPVAHGVLTLGYFSKVLGTRLPGPGTIFAGLDEIRFRKAVRAGDLVDVAVIVKEVASAKKPIKLPKPRGNKTHVLAGMVKLSLEAKVGKNVVLTGTATVFVESREDAPPAPPKP